MHKKFEINRTKIKGGCQSGRKVVTHNSKSDLPPDETTISVGNRCHELVDCNQSIEWQCFIFIPRGLLLVFLKLFQVAIYNQAKQ